MIEPYIILIILVITMGFFIWGKWRYDVVAMIALMASAVAGAVPLPQVYSGLTNPAVITVACIMIISAAISRTGILDIFVRKTSHLTKNAFLHISILTVLAALLSSFMNNIGALALIMPIAIQTANENNRSPSLVLMPIAFASALGGLTTIIGTPPNLLISMFRQEQTGHPFSMFDFSYVGVPIAIIGVVFIIVIGWRLMPSKRKGAKNSEDLYQVQEYMTEIKVPEGSTTIGKTIREFEKLIEDEFIFIGFIRNKKKRFSFQPYEEIKENDILIVEASTEALNALIRIGKLELVGDKEFSADVLKSDEIGLMEAVVPQNSYLDGRSIKSIRLRARYSINLLAIARQGTRFRQRLHQTELKAGDVVLLQGAKDILHENIINLGLLPLVERDIRVGQSTKFYVPIVVFFIAIVVSAFQLVPIQVAFGGAVVFMVLLNAIPIRLLYDSVEWPIIVLLAAMIPIGSALQTTGGTRLIAEQLVLMSGHMPDWLLLAALMVITMTISDFMNNAATAVVMAPIAVSIAHALKLNIDPFLMAFAVGASCSFLTPVVHQNNTLVLGPGGYRFTDYIRLGLPIEILILFFGTPLIIWAWPFH